MALIQEIASIIKNDIQSGLKGIGNYSFSIEQIEKEVTIKRNALIKKYSANRMIQTSELIQDLTCIPVSCEDISDCCDPVDTTKALRFEIPRPSTLFANEKSIQFIGLVDRATAGFRVYFDHGFIYHKYNKLTGKMPYVWINLGTVNANDTVYGYIFNKPRIKKITVAGVFEDPYAVQKCECIDTEDKRFPAPEFMVDEIITSIVYKYVQLYKTNPNELPNTQSSKNSV